MLWRLFNGSTTILSFDYTILYSSMYRAVAEAYEVLRDAKRRKQYEDMGHSSFYSNTGYRPTGDFKDLFKDFEDLFKEFGPMEDFFKQHFASHKIQTEAHGGIFDFGTDINFNDLFGGSETGFDASEILSAASENLHDHLHQHGAELLKDVPGTEKEGKNCKTITKKVGNSVTTYTQCTSATSTTEGKVPNIDQHVEL